MVKRLSSIGLCAALWVFVPVAATTQESSIPTPAEDLQMLHAFREQTLIDLGLTEDLTQYRNPQKVYPPPGAITPEDAKRRFVFSWAIAKVQLELMGQPFEPSKGSTTQDQVKRGLMALLKKVFVTFAPGDLESLANTVKRTWGIVRPPLDPEQIEQASAEGQAAARAMLRAFVSPERAATYDTVPMLQQADLLLEASEIVINARSWPTAYILFLNDTNDGYGGRLLVSLYLGASSQEYQSWPEMTDRQRGAAAKKALLAAVDAGRQYAQGRLDLERLLSRVGLKGDKMFEDPDPRILMAGGRQLLDQYEQAGEQEKRDIVIAATLKTAGWVWTMQAAL